MTVPDEDKTAEDFDAVWDEALFPEDTCCACYGCPDHGHDCGLPPVEAALRRASFLHKEAKIMELLIVQGHVMVCRECKGLFDPRMVFGECCIEHGGVLQAERPRSRRR